ncbi:MAG TPA: hypothetical protein VE932_11025 [Patescibacteria group bacterium]|nr:hypothetical protein [Patescibacteria group bacterium]
MARPRLVAGARARGGETAHVQTSELEIQTEVTEARIGAGLGDDGAHPRRDVDASPADGHLAGRDGDPEHAGTLAPADE